MPVIDDHEGTEVCIKCGKVLEMSLYYNSMPTFEIERKIEFSDYYEYLLRLNAPSNLVGYCEKIAETFQTKRNKIGIVLYITLLHNNIPRTLKEISSITGFCTNELWKALTEYQEQTKDFSFIHPVDITERCCKILELTFTDFCHISKLVKDVYNFNLNHHPASIVGFAIFTHCKENKIKLSIRKISNALGISSISIRRLLKRKYEIDSSQ